LQVLVLKSSSLKCYDTQHDAFLQFTQFIFKLYGAVKKHSPCQGFEWDLQYTIWW